MVWLIQERRSRRRQILLGLADVAAGGQILLQLAGVVAAGRHCRSCQQAICIISNVFVHCLASKTLWSLHIWYPRFPQLTANRKPRHTTMHNYSNELSSLIHTARPVVVMHVMRVLELEVESGDDRYTVLPVERAMLIPFSSSPQWPCWEGSVVLVLAHQAR